MTLGDLRRWFLAGIIGPLVGVPVFLGFVVAAGVTVRPVAALLVLLSAVLSQLALLVPFLRVRTDPQRVSDAERTAQWAAVAAATFAVFMLQTDVAWAYVVVPLLAWGAVRLPLRQMTIQLLGTTVAVLCLAVVGIGPFGYRGDVSTATVIEATQLHLFLLSGVLLVVPYALIAQQLRERSAEAHHEREFVRRIMDSATRTAIIALDRDGTITSFNVGAERLLGHRAEDMLGATPDALVPRAELRAQAEAVRTTREFHRIARELTRTTTEPRDWKLRRASGEVRTHSLSITPMTDPGGRIVGYVCTSEDVTARVERKDALRAALQSEREAVERLEQADRMKDALVSTVSHELRTPLTSILGYTAMLADGDFGDLPTPVAQTLDRILTNGERLRSLVEDLLVLSRVNAGQLDLGAAPVDIGEVVRTAHDVLAPAIAQRDLTVRLTLPAQPALINGDGAAIERVVLNLLSNAVKFTPDGGRVSVQVKLDDDEVSIEVSDTGHGIPMAEQSQLFHQFFRSSIAKREAIQGTGLGLSIAQAIVQQHCGVIGATSEPGVGSTFLVVLPRLPESAGGHPRSQGQAEQAAG